MFAKGIEVCSTMVGYLLLSAGRGCWDVGLASGLGIWKVGEGQAHVYLLRGKTRSLCGVGFCA